MLAVEMPETIEAEVIAIDGRPPERGPASAGRVGDAAPYSERFRQRVLQLDRRWWPLWTVLGILLVAALVTVGLLVAVFQVLWLLIRTVFRAFFQRPR